MTTCMTQDDVAFSVDLFALAVVGFFFLLIASELKQKKDDEKIKIFRIQLGFLSPSQGTAYLLYRIRNIFKKLEELMPGLEELTIDFSGPDDYFPFYFPRTHEENQYLHPLPLILRAVCKFVSKTPIDSQELRVCFDGHHFLRKVTLKGIRFFPAERPILLRWLQVLGEFTEAVAAGSVRHLCLDSTNCLSFQGFVAFCSSQTNTAANKILELRNLQLSSTTDGTQNYSDLVPTNGSLDTLILENVSFANGIARRFADFFLPIAITGTLDLGSVTSVGDEGSDDPGFALRLLASLTTHPIKRLRLQSTCKLAYFEAAVNAVTSSVEELFVEIAANELGEKVDALARVLPLMKKVNTVQVRMAQPIPVWDYFLPSWFRTTRRLPQKRILQAFYNSITITTIVVLNFDITVDQEPFFNSKEEQTLQEIAVRNRGIRALLMDYHRPKGDPLADLLVQLNQSPLAMHSFLCQLPVRKAHQQN